MTEPGAPVSTDFCGNPIFLVTAILSLIHPSKNTTMIAALLSALVLVSALFTFFFAKDFLGNRVNTPGSRWQSLLGIGFGTNFFDTLGIGSFAPTTAIFKFFRLVEDRHIPGTLNVGHALPVVTQALIFITIIQVETTTLLSMITTSVAGAVLGAGIVSKLPERKIQWGMGLALLVVAVALVASLLGLYPLGGDAVGLDGWKLYVALAVSFILGVIMMIGVGFYAPCMALVYALGLSPLVAFPIMMGACAFLMPAAGLKFVKEKAYNRTAALGLTLGGIPGVLLAAFIIRSLPLNTLKWLILGVILYASYAMFKSALRKP
jgi:uncharacterized membrane protein YfcA